MSVTQPDQAAALPVFAVGPDQIQGRHAAVSADGATFCASRRCRRNLEKRHEKRRTASASDPAPNYFAATAARWQGVKNYFSLMALQKCV